MQQAWALLLPSVKEGWGMVVTEAGACGTPGIVTDVTGLRDSVVRDVTGRHIPRNPSAGELAGSMMRLISDGQKRLQLSREAQKYSEKFEWETSFRIFSEHIT
jgi:glycosyltransferase involved in cell wall biosynthesis